MLDPEQNNTFRDNYLDVPFDLSRRPSSIATANALDNVPGPVRDRMEVIELPGYTQEEKLQIARAYLVTRQREANGLAEGQCELTDEALSSIVADYTREAGVRQLEREIGRAMRHAAMEVAEGSAQKVHIGAPELDGILGAPKFEREVALRSAWACPALPSGSHGRRLAARSCSSMSMTRGSGRLVLTGQLGDVMKESAQAALTYLLSHAGTLEIDAQAVARRDIHIHIPAGAVPKDGPSAGIHDVRRPRLAAQRQAREGLPRHDRRDHAQGACVARGRDQGEGSCRGARRPVAPCCCPPATSRTCATCRPAPATAMEFVPLENVDDAIRCALAEPSPEVAAAEASERVSA